MSEDSETTSSPIIEPDQALNQSWYASLRKWFIKIWEWFLQYLVIGLSLIAIVTILGWATVNFVLQPRYDNSVSINLLDESGMYATVSYPVGIPANGITAKFQYFIDNSLDVTQTVTLTAVLPKETLLLLTNAPFIPSIEIAPHTHISSTMLLVNAVPPKLESQEEPITFTITVTNNITPSSSITPTNNITSTAIITVSAESVWAGRIRRFVTSTVNNASPLIIFFVSLTIIIRWYVKEQRKLDKEKEQASREIEEKQLEAQQQKEKRNREIEEKRLEAQRQKEQKDREIQKKQLEIQQQEQYKQEAAEFVGKIRRSIINNQLDKADIVLSELQKPTHEKFESESLHTAQQLVKLARLECNPDEIMTIVQECSVWADESVSAFINAWHKNGTQTEPLKQAYMDTLLQARYWLPMVQVNPELQGQLSNIELEIIARRKEQVQFRPSFKRWPKSKEYPNQSSIPFNLFINSFPNKQDPFAHRYAEKDLYALFRLERGAFWGGHPVFNNLFTHSDQPSIVIGVNGSGRTTLAYGLHYHAIERDTFALHVSGTPSLNAIHTGFVEHLLDFSLQHPANLRRLTVAQRNLLATLFISNREKSTLLAQIETEQTTIYSSFSAFTRDEKKNAVSQLRLLAKAINNVEIPQKSNDLNADALSISVHSLGFTHCILSLDIPDSSVEWAKQEILPNLLRWHMQGLRTIIFASKNTVNGLEIPDGVYQHHLIWNEAQLKRLFRWRYRASIERNKREVFEQYFGDGMLDYLVKQALTPGYLFQLWHTIIEFHQPNEQISKMHIKRALEQSKGKMPIAITYTPQEGMPDNSCIWDYEEQEVAQILEQGFSQDDLDALWFNLPEMKEEEKPKTSTISEYARHIVAYCKRRKLLSVLNQYVYNKRSMYPSRRFVKKRCHEL